MVLGYWAEGTATDFTAQTECGHCADMSLWQSYAANDSQGPKSKAG